MQLDAKATVTFTGTAETDFVQLAQAPLMCAILKPKSITVKRK